MAIHAILQQIQDVFSNMLETIDEDFKKNLSSEVLFFIICQRLNILYIISWKNVQFFSLMSSQQMKTL